ncbi:MAG: SAM-dependent chlorinase/fluorinase [Nitrospinota bacterium]|nr:SAM-dependent chlorinase/fluorinase [Nitrospinota bacterium]
MAVVTLTTDFGLSDGYTGVMKGVMLSIAPSLSIVDVTHDIRPQAIVQAAFILGAAYPNFPLGSIHVCVVDPGVGSQRKPLAIHAGGRFFLGPDNGVFTRVFLRHPDFVAHEITNKEYMAPKVSFTFHGRDVFAPAAAHLASGAALESFGPKVASTERVKAEDASLLSPDVIKGAIVHIDHYGNAVTNIDIGLLETVMKEGNYTRYEVVHHAGKVGSILRSYSEAVDMTALCVTVGSWNTLEFFTRLGHAANIHGLCVNDHVKVRFS